MPDWFNMEIAARAAAVFGVVVLGCSSMLAAIAPLTKNDWDDGLAKWWVKYPVKLVSMFSVFTPKQLKK